jgi:thioredoxin reductase (NADPH)
MGLETLTASDANTFDILVIGAGPAGLTAAIYGAKANLKVGFIEYDVPGGKIVNLPNITNYPGYKAVNGADLALNMYTQATESGAIYIFGKVTGITKRQNYHVAFLENGVNYFAKSIILATGTTEIKLNVPGESEYTNKGVSYCVLCDGMLTKNKNSVIFGNSDIAILDAIYLAGISRKVYLVTKEAKINADQISVQMLKKYPNIEIINDAICSEIKGDKQQVTSVDINLNGAIKSLSVSYVFVVVGSHSDSSLLAHVSQAVDKDGIVITDENRQTKVEGIFAAGDLIKSKYHQISTAVGDGALAAISAIKYIKQE